MSRNKSNKTKVTPVVELEVAPTLEGLSAENSVLSMRLAEANVEKDRVLSLYEKTVEASHKESQSMQEKLNLQAIHIEYQDNLFEEIKGQLVEFSILWNELEGKPVKRFFAVFSFIGKLMKVVDQIVEKINKK